MLLKLLRFVGIGAASLALSQTALAEANVTTDSASAKLGGEFRGGFWYYDNGLQKTDDVTPSATSGVRLEVVSLKLDGKYNSNTEFHLRFSMLGAGDNVNYAYGTHWFSKMMGFSLGRSKVMQGGWDLWHYSPHSSHVIGKYADGSSGHLPFDQFEDNITLHFAVGGMVSLQLLNDVTNAEGDSGSWNEDAHLTYLLNWMGKFGPIAPWVTIGSYDNNHSQLIELGVKTSMSGLDASLDFSQNTRSAKTPKDDGDGHEDGNSVTTAITLNAGYMMKGTARPFFYYSTFNNAQYTADGEDEPETNTAGTWDDNAATWGLGADLLSFGSRWTPYVFIASDSGKFKEGEDDKTKSDMWFKVGCYGDI